MISVTFEKKNERKSWIKASAEESHQLFLKIFNAGRMESIRTEFYKHNVSRS